MSEQNPPAPVADLQGASLTGLPLEPLPPLEPPAAPEPGKGALLYYGPGIVTRMWETRIRNGQWADIAAEFNAAHARIHLPTLRRNDEIRLDLSTGAHHIAAVFDAHPEAHGDEKLAEGFRDVETAFEAELEAQRTRLHLETLHRIAALRSDLGEYEAESRTAA